MIILLITLFLWLAKPVSATGFDVAEASAQQHFLVDVPDPRVLKLEANFDSHNSPLLSEASHFVSEADRLGIDWKLVAAIAGV